MLSSNESIANLESFEMSHSVPPNHVPFFHSNDQDGTYIVPLENGDLELYSINQGGYDSTTVSISELLQFLRARFPQEMAKLTK